MPDYYPAFIDVRNRVCIVIGGGEIGEDKTLRLLECRAKVTVISPKVTDKVESLALNNKITWFRRKYVHGDLSDCFIAVAATNDNTVNKDVSKEARKRNVLLNVVDVTHLCTFIAPSVARRGKVTIATSTEGASPALARKFREEISRSKLIQYADLVPLLSEARNELKRLSVKVSPDHWQTCIDESLLKMVQAGKISDAKKTLKSKLLQGKLNSSASN